MHHGLFMSTNHVKEKKVVQVSNSLTIPIKTSKYFLWCLVSNFRANSKLPKYLWNQYRLTQYKNWVYIRRHEGLLNILWTFNLRTAGRGCLSVKNTELNIFQSFQGHNCEAQLQTEQRRSIRIHVKSGVETYSKPT